MTAGLTKNNYLQQRKNLIARRRGVCRPHSASLARRPRCRGSVRCDAVEVLHLAKLKNNSSFLQGFPLFPFFFLLRTSLLLSFSSSPSPPPPLHFLRTLLFLFKIPRCTQKIPCGSVSGGIFLDPFSSIFLIKHATSSSFSIQVTTIPPKIIPRNDLNPHLFKSQKSTGGLQTPPFPTDLPLRLVFEPTRTRPHRPHLTLDADATRERRRCLLKVRPLKNYMKHLVSSLHTRIDWKAIWSRG